MIFLCPDQDIGLGILKYRYTSYQPQKEATSFWFVKIIAFVTHLMKSLFIPEFKEYTDKDGDHPYYLPDMSDPEAWRDYINHPDDMVKEDWFALGQQELDNALLVI